MLERAEYLIVASRRMAALGQTTIIPHFSHASSRWEEPSRLACNKQHSQSRHNQQSPPAVSTNPAQNLDTTQKIPDSYRWITTIISIPRFLSYWPSMEHNEYNPVPTSTGTKVSLKKLLPSISYVWDHIIIQMSYVANENAKGGSTTVYVCQYVYHYIHANYILVHVYV